MSPKLKDIISKCDVISSGSPVVYQLKPKEDTFESLTRKTLGEKDLTKNNKTILLVGEIGAGKSTLLNALVNFMVGVTFEDNVWFEFVEKEEEKCCWESRTSDVIVYEILGFEALPYSLTIIDTPGYGDTSRMEQDVTSQRLKQWFDGGVHELHAVGLVMKASDNRLSDRLMYVLNSVMSLFGEDLEKNIVALITHSDGRKPRNALQALEAARIKCARNDQNEPVHFLFNNCQHEDRTENRDYLEKADAVTQRGLSQFIQFLDKSAPEKVKTTVNVLEEQKRLAACVQNLQDRIRESERKQKEVEQIQEALKKHEEEMKKNENFTIEVDEVYKDNEHIDATCCSCCFPVRATTCPDCEENCHYHCKTLCTCCIRLCKVMKRGRCTVCTNKCPASDHKKTKWRYVTKTRKVQKTLHDLKEKYEQHKTESEAKLSLKLNLETEMIELSREKKSLLEESYQHIVRLEQIALNVDSLSTHVHLDFLIEKMKETGDTEKVQNLEEMSSRQAEDEGTRAALTYARR